MKDKTGVAENIGAAIDKALQESPILMKQYVDLQKKYDELKELNDTQALEIMSLKGQVLAYEKILNIKEEEN